MMSMEPPQSQASININMDPHQLLLQQVGIKASNSSMHSLFQPKVLLNPSEKSIVKPKAVKLRTKSSFSIDLNSIKLKDEVEDIVAAGFKESLKSKTSSSA